MVAIGLQIHFATAAGLFLIAINAKKAASVALEPHFTSCRDLISLPKKTRFGLLYSIRGGDNDNINNNDSVDDNGGVAADAVNVGDATTSAGAAADVAADTVNVGEADTEIPTTSVDGRDDSGTIETEGSSTTGEDSPVVEEVIPPTLRHKPLTRMELLSQKLPMDKLQEWHQSVRRSISTLGTQRLLPKRDLLLKIGPYVLSSNETPLSNVSVFAMALLGSSVGFVSFLYFISIGYGIGVALPALAILWSYNTLSENIISPLTNLHTVMVAAWGMRLAYFLLHREFITWKQWHTKISEVNQKAKIAAKFSVWMSCTLIYASLVAPCLYRMRQASSTSTIGTDVNAAWGPVGKLGLGLQMSGLFLEILADMQKSKFKAVKDKDDQGNDVWNNRNRPCLVGVWRYFTHPNYLGDALFWIGTYVAGLGALETVSQALFSSFGMLTTAVVLRGATEQLDKKQLKNYNKDTEFVQHREEVGFLGPKKLIP